MYLNQICPGVQPQLRRPKTLLSNGFIIPRPPLPNGIIMNRSTPNLLSESHNNQEGNLVTQPRNSCRPRFDCLINLHYTLSGLKMQCLVYRPWIIQNQIIKS